ncbi:type II toxin-antitoxin system RelE/ParE family toxin [Parvularcula lutaonensis]|uniref:Type II toxin-antitoxin system RelE/ParE family toxin n=1 Tax=Parvularcula lutaonensis TaxID=491923 RepID=A0ABV7MFI4_9PROT|nr:type II toxin-antitoxin system RelE/ParE family toxin [Parvularcula lutaonensis]GGY57225.1 addiction module killer protein [Parvularcula lutaonensis]
MFQIEEYTDETDSSPFADWFGSLDHQAANRVRTAIRRMEQGLLGDHKGVGEGVIERRLTFGPGYRIYFGRDGDTLIILLAGGTKRRQSVDIEAAQQRWSDYKERKELSDGTDTEF